MKWLKKIVKRLHERYEVEDFVEQLKQEQANTRENRIMPIELWEYELQEGMLPKDWADKKPKPTGKHFNDYTWAKVKK